MQANKSAGSVTFLKMAATASPCSKGLAPLHKEMSKKKGVKNKTHEKRGEKNNNSTSAHIKQKMRDFVRWSSSDAIRKSFCTLLPSASGFRQSCVLNLVN
jgi:hypothetical protein